MNSEVAESLREMAGNLLAAASRLDGIVSADAMRVVPEGGIPAGYEIGTGDGGGQVLRCLRCSGWERPIFGKEGEVALMTQLHDDHRHGTLISPPLAELERVSVKVMTGRGFGVYVHRDPINPLQIDDCDWPHSQCSGHRTGLGGMPLLTVPDDQAMYVPHWHASAPGRLCSEIMCHATHGRPCRYCGGARCRITPVERSA